MVFCGVKGVSFGFSFLFRLSCFFLGRWGCGGSVWCCFSVVWSFFVFVFFLFLFFFVFFVFVLVLVFSHMFVAFFVS